LPGTAQKGAERAGPGTIGMENANTRVRHIPAFLNHLYRAGIDITQLTFSRSDIILLPVDRD